MSKVEVVIGFSSANINSVNMSNYNRQSKFKGGTYYDSVVETESANVNAFVVGSSKVGTSMYASGYSGYISNCGSSNNEFIGNDGVKYGYKLDNNIELGKFAITINGSGIKNIEINFDKLMGSYPTVVYINNELYVNDSYDLKYSFNNEQDGVAIDMHAMSAPMKPVVINKISFDNSLRFGLHSGLKSISINRQRTNNPTGIEYGIVPQSASINVQDSKNSVFGIINQGESVENLPITVYIDGKVGGTYLSQSVWDYNVFTKVVSINTSDRLVKLQDTQYTLKYNGEPKTALDIVNELISNSSDFNFEIEPETREFLESVNIEYPYLQQDSLWNQWNKVCQLCQLVVYSLTNGVIYVKRII